MRLKGSHEGSKVVKLGLKVIRWVILIFRMVHRVLTNGNDLVQSLKHTIVGQTKFIILNSR